MGLHQRAALLYDAPSVLTLAQETQPKLPDDSFQNLMRFVFNVGGVTPESLTGAEPQHFIQVHTEALAGSFSQVEMSPAMRTQLKRSARVFSGFKTFHEMKEAMPSLIDADGNKKPFEQFLNDVQKVDEQYNVNYLRAEYNFAVQSAQMAAKWEQIEKDGNRYDLQYRTMEDDRVRDEHAALNGITLPADDPFWEENYPPNGWNCRCTVVQVRKGKYPVSDSGEAVKKGKDATGGKHREMMRFNSGKQKKVFPDYNAYTLSGCATCTKKGGTLNLAADTPDNELCRACGVIREPLNAKSIKEASKEAYGWVGEHVPEKGYVLPETTDKETFKLRVSRGALKDVVDHFKTPEDKMKITTLTDLFPKREYTHSALLGEGKKGDPEKVRKNLEKKQRRGVVSYNYYDVAIGGEVWELNCEVFKEGYEKPYALKRKKR